MPRMTTMRERLFYARLRWSLPDLMRGPSSNVGTNGGQRRIRKEEERSLKESQLYFHYIQQEVDVIKIRNLTCVHFPFLAHIFNFSLE